MVFVGHINIVQLLISSLVGFVLSHVILLSCHEYLICRTFSRQFGNDVTLWRTLLIINLLCCDFFLAEKLRTEKLLPKVLHECFFFFFFLEWAENQWMKLLEVVNDIILLRTYRAQKGFSFVYKRTSL